MDRAQKSHKCRLCGSTEIHDYFTCRGYNLFQCDACAYVQIADRPPAAEISEIYGDCYFVSNKYKDTNILDWENQRRLKILASFLPHATARVLDAGCAAGDFLLTAKNQYQMHGCDISSFAVDIARKKNPDIADNIFVSDLDACALQAGMYDAICLWDVIEHLWDPLVVCNALATMLKPSGLIFISTPDIGSVTARLMRQRWAFMTPPEHMGFFNSKSLRHLFEKILPFRIVYRKISGKWTNLGFLVYKLRRVLPALVPEALVNALGKSRVGRLPLYVPTHDIQYIVAQK